MVHVAGVVNEIGEMLVCKGDESINQLQRYCGYDKGDGLKRM